MGNDNTGVSHTPIGVGGDLDLTITISIIGPKNLTVFDNFGEVEV